MSEDKKPSSTLAVPDVARQAIRDVQFALAEDIGPGDLLDKVAGNQPVRARIETRTDCVLAGGPWVDATLAACSGENDWSCDWAAKESSFCKQGSTLAVITAQANALLAAERTMLNFLGLLCGVATAAKRVVDAAGDVPVFDTRKTLPNLRAAQRYATRTGGMHNNRAGLYDTAIIKDNHIEASESLTKAYEKACNTLQKDEIQVEVGDFEQLKEALQAQVTRIMLDNWTVEDIKTCIKQHKGLAEFEATGSITADNAKAYAATGVDRLSSSCATRSPDAIDLTMIFEG